MGFFSSKTPAQKEYDAALKKSGVDRLHDKADKAFKAAQRGGSQWDWERAQDKADAAQRKVNRSIWG